MKKIVNVTLTYLITMEVDEKEDNDTITAEAREIVENGEWSPNDVEIEEV